ncbi:MAG: DMT family transporter [Candidatus Magasanikbacteria bacterium]
MTWLLSSLSSALFDSFKLLTIKDKVDKEYNEYFIAFIVALFTSVVSLVPTLFLDSQIFTPETDYLLALAIVVSINLITLVLTTQANNYSDLSTLAPLYSFSPLFVALTAFFILGEKINTIGFLGIALIVSGTFVVNKNKKDKYFKNINIDLGQIMIILSTILWSISSVYFKVGMNESSSFGFVFVVYSLISIILFIVIMFKKVKIKENFKKVINVGLTSALTSIFQWYAVSIGPTAYALAVKRASSIFSVIWGKLFLKEKNFILRICGASIIFIGVLLIVYA